MIAAANSGGNIVVAPAHPSSSPKAGQTRAEQVCRTVKQPRL
jgi:hypothetical protein